MGWLLCIGPATCLVIGGGKQKLRNLPDKTAVVRGLLLLLAVKLAERAGTSSNTMPCQGGCVELLLLRCGWDVNYPSFLQQQQQQQQQQQTEEHGAADATAAISVDLVTFLP